MSEITAQVLAQSASATDNYISKAGIIENAIGDTSNSLAEADVVVLNTSTSITTSESVTALATAGLTLTGASISNTDSGVLYMLVSVTPTNSTSVGTIKVYKDSALSTASLVAQATMSTTTATASTTLSAANSSGLGMTVYTNALGSSTFTSLVTITVNYLIDYEKWDATNWSATGSDQQYHLKGIVKDVNSTTGEIQYYGEGTVAKLNSLGITSISQLLRNKVVAKLRDVGITII